MRQLTHFSWRQLWSGTNTPLRAALFLTADQKLREASRTFAQSLVHWREPAAGQEAPGVIDCRGPAGRLATGHDFKPRTGVGSTEDGRDHWFARAPPLERYQENPVVTAGYSWCNIFR